MNDCSTLLAIICYISLSQTNILFAFVLFCCCFLEADQEEDESKKRQVALICGACAESGYHCSEPDCCNTYSL